MARMVVQNTTSFRGIPHFGFREQATHAQLISAPWAPNDADQQM